MTPPIPADATPPASAHTGGFEFVRDLAHALADGAIELPSYPQVALRLQKLLADDDTDADQLVRVLGAEPVLAARITAMAGSAALNPAGRAVSDLRTAVVLMGHDALRTTTTAYAMAQLRQATEYLAIAPAVAELWRESSQRAAMCFVLARHAGGFRPDTAMLAGLLAGIGKLYLARACCPGPARELADRSGNRRRRAWLAAGCGRCRQHRRTRRRAGLGRSVRRLQ